MLLLIYCFSFRGPLGNFCDTISNIDWDKNRVQLWVIPKANKIVIILFIWALYETKIWANNSLFLHHHNAPAHISLDLREHYAKISTHIVPQPPFSPDSTPIVFWLFPKLKRPLRGTRFNSIEEMKNWRWRWWLYQKGLFGMFRGLGKNVDISVFYREKLISKNK